MALLSNKKHIQQKVGDCDSAGRNDKKDVKNHNDFFYRYSHLL